MVHSLFFEHFELIICYFSLISILLESSWNFTSFGGSFVWFRVVLTKLWAFEGMQSLCNWFLDNNLLLQNLRSILIQSSSFTYCWKAIEISLLLVLVLLSFELYWESSDCLRVGWVWEVDFKPRSTFAHSDVNHDPIFPICILLERYWNYAAFGGSFA